MLVPGCVPLPVASQVSTCSVLKKPKIQPDKVCRVETVYCPGCGAPWPTKDTFGGFWVHIHFAVYGSVGVLLSQHLSRTLQEKVNWN